jgi:hypothetical protein
MVDPIEDILAPAVIERAVSIFEPYCQTGRRINLADLPRTYRPHAEVAADDGIEVVRN